MHLTDSQLKDLELKANDIRMTIIDMLEDAGSGHTAGPLGLSDLFAALYFNILDHDPNNWDKPDRDRLILSCGHTVPVRYAAMAHAGYFPLSETKTLRQFGSRLQGHPERVMLGAMENTSGPLGEGLSQAAGMAYAAKMDGAKWRTYCVMSDGEQQAGNIWEAAMFAGANQLSNLTAFIDRNNIQINGMTEKVMPLEPLADKWKAFNWHVIEVNGHDIEAIIDATEEAKAIYERPTLILCHTIPGKGIKEIEFDHVWHGKPPKPEEEKKFLDELRTLRGKITASHNE